jgi:fructose-1,6-bisphosphatase/inositol monophosphatase family enzyme
MSDRLLAERLVRAAGGLALELRGGPARAKEGATDVVTEADERAEALLLDILREERPGDGVVGEEGAAVEGGPRRWLLDPVDGTLNYAAGLPVWCAAVVLLDGDGPLACAVHDPVHDELWSAARGEGATLNGAPLRLGPRGEAPAADAPPAATGVAAPRGDVVPPAAAVAAPPLADATVATFVDARRRDADISRATDALAARVGALRALGCGTLELAWVAAGRLHGWIQPDVAPWDWHPGALLVREAGGVTRVAGRWHVAAASEPLTAELLERLP